MQPIYTFRFLVLLVALACVAASDVPLPDADFIHLEIPVEVTRLRTLARKYEEDKHSGYANHYRTLSAKKLAEFVKELNADLAGKPSPHRRASLYRALAEVAIWEKKPQRTRALLAQSNKALEQAFEQDMKAVGKFLGEHPDGARTTDVVNACARRIHLHRATGKDSWEFVRHFQRIAVAAVERKLAGPGYFPTKIGDRSINLNKLADVSTSDLQRLIKDFEKLLETEHRRLQATIFEPGGEDRWLVVPGFQDANPSHHAVVLHLTGRDLSIRAYPSRSGRARDALLKKYGGNWKTERAVENALRWLSKNQNRDGSWGDTNKPAYTSLVLLCYFGHGESMGFKSYGRTVTKGVLWLQNAFDKRDRGKLLERAYTHGIGVMALAEAYRVRPDARSQAILKKAVAVIIEGQQKGGGFSYHYAKRDRWDLSVTGWQVQALAYTDRAGIKVTGLEAALQKAGRFLREDASDNKTFGYSGKGGSPNLTGCGALCLQLLGSPKALAVTGGIEFITKKRLSTYNWEGAGGRLYGWYYDTQAMYMNAGESAQAWHAWSTWNKNFTEVLLKAQQSNGSWLQQGGHFGRKKSGRIFATVLCTLQLEVYYRNAHFLEPKPKKTRKKKK